MIDLILYNGRVLTMDAACPTAQLVAIAGNRILEVAGDDRLAKLASGHTRMIDCAGKTVLPGLIDAHGHIPALAESLVTMNLGPHQGIRSMAEIKDKIREASRDLAQDRWIRAGGYDESALAEQRHPTRADLDEAAPRQPVKLTHRTGHAHVLNTRGLKLAGISIETPDPPGGLIDREIPSGEPTGLLFGMGDFLSPRIPPLEDEELDQGMKAAGALLLSSGITSVQDASPRNGLERWQEFHRWKGTGLLPSRVTMMQGFREFKKHDRHEYINRIGEAHLRLGPVKVMTGRASGQLHPSPAELYETAREIHDSGMQGAFHALEEPVIEEIRRVLEEILARSPRPDHRHRLEHCSVCPPDLARRLAALGIAVVTQPSFVYFNGARYLKTVPAADLHSLYPLRTFLRNQILTAAGSDAPIAPVNPFAGIYGAVSRQAQSGESLNVAEKISVGDALHMYTDRAARANFEENVKGSITPGKLADVIVLNRDIRRISAEEIKDLKVEITVLDGRVVWEKNFSEWHPAEHSL